MQLRVGTSGYSYKEWKGPFYPSDLPAKRMLDFYASKLPSVEINSTFYRLPKQETLDGWKEQVPESFRFVIKASRRITHLKRLKDAADETTYLLDTVGRLGDQLGAVLFQLPPNLKCDLERLETFLDLLPGGTRAVFEFRHETWNDPAVHDLLRARNIALCTADTDEGDAEPVVSTAGWGYLRLRREAYDDAQLAAWVARVQEQSWTEAFVFFKHEDDAAGPKMAARFLAAAS